MKYLEKTEKVIVVSLLVMMVAVVLLSTIELGWLIIKDISTPPVFFLEIDELLDIFGMFLFVLIGLELLETVKMYLTKKTMHAEVRPVLGQKWLDTGLFCMGNFIIILAFYLIFNLFISRKKGRFWLGDF